MPRGEGVSSAEIMAWAKWTRRNARQRVRAWQNRVRSMDALIRALQRAQEPAGETEDQWEGEDLDD